MEQIMFKALSCEELNDINGGGIGKYILQFIKILTKKKLTIGPMSVPHIIWNK